MAKKRRPYGRLFRLIRKVDLHMTQQDVADALGISQSNLSKIETDKAEPSAEQFLDFAELAYKGPARAARTLNHFWQTGGELDRE